MCDTTNLFLLGWASISMKYFLKFFKGKDKFDCKGATSLVAYICIYLHHQVNFSIESVRI